MILILASMASVSVLATMSTSASVRRARVRPARHHNLVAGFMKSLCHTPSICLKPLFSMSLMRDVSKVIVMAVMGRPVPVVLHSAYCGSMVALVTNL